jgi:hypothetical protein
MPCRTDVANIGRGFRPGLREFGYQRRAGAVHLATILATTGPEAPYEDAHNAYYVKLRMFTLRLLTFILQFHHSPAPCSAFTGSPPSRPTDRCSLGVVRPGYIGDLSA